MTIELQDVYPVQNVNNDDTVTGIRNILIAGKSNEATAKVRPILVDASGRPLSRLVDSVGNNIDDGSGNLNMKLNGSIDSIFSYATANTKVLVSAGSIVSPYGASIVINDYKKLFCVAREVNLTAHDFDILVYWRTSTGIYLYSDVYNINSHSNLTGQFDVIAHRVVIKLRNNDTVDHEYYIELGGVR